MPTEAHYYDDLAVGDTFETRGRTVTETHLVQHAGTTGDMNELQMNAEFAADTEFGERVVHAPLTYAMMEGLITSDFRHEDSNVCYYGLDSMRIPEPTYVGDTISGEVTVADARAMAAIVESQTDEAWYRPLVGGLPVQPGAFAGGEAWSRLLEILECLPHARS